MSGKLVIQLKNHDRGKIAWDSPAHLTLFAAFLVITISPNPAEGPSTERSAPCFTPCSFLELTNVMQNQGKEGKHLRNYPRPFPRRYKIMPTAVVLQYIA